MTPEHARKLLEGATPGPWRYGSMGCGDYYAPAIMAGDADVTGQLSGVCDEADGRMLAAAPDLARAYLDEVELRKKAEAECGRLRRTLAVERGDESQAPEGWAATKPGSWRKVDAASSVRVALVHMIRPGLYNAQVHGRPPLHSEHPTALEAMEAAEAALAGAE